MEYELLYKLNLPPIEDVLKDFNSINSYVSESFRGSQIFYPDPKDLFKEEWLSFNGYDWDYASLFIRTEKQNSIIHRDNPHSPESLHWGINWVWGGESYMDYWTLDKIDTDKIIYDTGGKTTAVLETKQPPVKTYLAGAGAYLINASIPHRVRNISNGRRIAISLRSSKLRKQGINENWSDVVEKFQKFIA